MNCLVVDASPTMRRIVARHLANYGRVALEASSAQEALTRIKSLEEHVDLMTTDWDLFDEDGLSLIASVRESHPDLPILMITARNSLADVQKALDTGIQGYLLKPINGELLQERLGEILPPLPEAVVKEPEEASAQSPEAESEDNQDTPSGGEASGAEDAPQASGGESEEEVKEAA